MSSDTKGYSLVFGSIESDRLGAIRLGQSQCSDERGLELVDVRRLGVY